jgi:ATP-dependent helicase/nuclease subunit B
VTREHLNLFNISAGLPFLDVLTDAILQEQLGLSVKTGEPSALAHLTVYLPTRRAARTLNSILSARFEGRPLLLPRIVPLGDVDNAEMSLITGDAQAFNEDVPVAIDPLRRRLELTRLVMACGRAVNRNALKLDPLAAPLMPATLADAFGLAGDLADLLDQLQTEGVSHEAIRKLDASTHDHLWEITATFLDVIGKAWPAFLEQQGLIDPAARRGLMLEAERLLLVKAPPPGPIIAAGSTGSVPATARLLNAIARLPNGAVVLPGLDMMLDEVSWEAISAKAEPATSHPQYALKHLLQEMKANRHDVRDLGVGAGSGPGAGYYRAALAQQALRPAATSDASFETYQRVSAEDLAKAFAGLTVIEAADERSEALAIAIALREVLELPGKTAALVTPDRGLAERVSVELQRWGVQADDSAGCPLFRTAAGHLAILVLEVVQSDFAPACILALLNHPMSHLGLPKSKVTRAACALEIGAIRGVMVRPGLAGLRAALLDAPRRAAERHAPRPRKALAAPDFGCVSQVLDHLDDRLSALSTSLGSGAPRLGDLARAHRQAFLDITARESDGAADPARSPDMDGVSNLFDTILNASGADRPLEAMTDYADIFQALSRESIVTTRGMGHPRLKIWGLLEARLLHADRLVIGGLVEGVWPPLTRTDAFLNRPMRQQAGLPAPEQRIGQTAHDFVQAIGAADVVLTRARKTGGTDTVPSRFWQRFEAVAPDNWRQAQERGNDLLHLAHALSNPAKIEPRAAPRPCPPARLQPASLSVTEIETLYRDPYAIYARHVLKLDPLDDFVIEPTAADRGTLLHAIVEQFAVAYPDQLPADAHARLVMIGRRCFDEAHDAPEVAAFWWPKFMTMAAKFIPWEESRRADLASIETETAASLEFDLADGTRFRLRAKADRIETTRSGVLRIIDFKSTRTPSVPQIVKGYAPQLTLQSALAIRGAYKAVGKRPVESAVYLKLLGSDNELKETPARKEAPTPETAEQHLEKLLRHIALYRAGKLPFVSHRAVDKISYVRPYDQLARVKEWTGAFGDGDTEDGS